MSETIKIRHIEAKPGEKANGFLEIANTASTDVKMPVAIINGSTPGPKLCLVGGVHCTEYEGIEAAVRTFQNTDPMNLKGALIICPVANTPGYQHGTLYVNPLDGINMNRVYPGNQNGTISEKMIYVLFTELVRLCDYHIDLHGGETFEDMGPFVISPKDVGSKEVEKKSAEMANYYLADITMTFSGKDGTSSSEIARIGIPSITPQAGALGAYREEDIQFHLHGIKNVMKWLGMLPKEGPPEPPKDKILRFAGNEYIRVKNGGIFYPKFRGSEFFKKGDVLAEIKDMFGNVIEEVIAPQDGYVCYYFPKRVKTAGEPAYSMWTPQ